MGYTVTFFFIFWLVWLPVEIFTSSRIIISKENELSIFLRIFCKNHKFTGVFTPFFDIFQAYFTILFSRHFLRNTQKFPFLKTKKKIEKLTFCRNMFFRAKKNFLLGFLQCVIIFFKRMYFYVFRLNKICGCSASKLSNFDKFWYPFFLF